VSFGLVAQVGESLAMESQSGMDGLQDPPEACFSPPECQDSSARSTASLRTLGSAAQDAKAFLGRWDMTATPASGTPYPQWMELTENNGRSRAASNPAEALGAPLRTRPLHPGSWW
jgi:hypothetical protein